MGCYIDELRARVVLNVVARPEVHGRWLLMVRRKEEDIGSMNDVSWCWWPAARAGIGCWTKSEQWGSRSLAWTMIRSGDSGD
jgi:hypothetical protein